MKLNVQNEIEFGINILGLEVPKHVRDYKLE